MTTLYRFPCGCSWPVLEDRGPGKLPLLDFDVEAAPEDCPATWALLAEGHTKGVFQLESQLGRTWSRKLRPESGEHMGALGALLRPGPLQARDDDGVSMTEHYARRKNGEEEVAAFHPAVDRCLASTYNVMTYQEQIMALGADLAGFDLVAVDKLRKAVAKKDQVELAKVRDLFLAGVARCLVVTVEQGQVVWGWIQGCGRYLFNKSHAISYGLTGYDTAYLKAHFPVQFFTAWLRKAHLKGNVEGGPTAEKRELVEDARTLGVEVRPPDLRRPEKHFFTDGQCVWFGWADVKGVGDTTAHKVAGALALAALELGRPQAELTWQELLLFVLPKKGVTQACLNSMARAGALDHFGRPRELLLAELKAAAFLNSREAAWAAAAYLAGTRWPDVASLLEQVSRKKKEGGATSVRTRGDKVAEVARLLREPPSALADTPVKLADYEEELLGLSLSVSHLEQCDSSCVNATCRDLSRGRRGKAFLGVAVRDVRLHRTKKGNAPGSPMAFLQLADDTGAFHDVVCFPEAFARYGHLLQRGKFLVVQGQLTREGSFAVEKAFEMA